MFALLLLVSPQAEKPYTIPLLAFANSQLPGISGDPIWQKVDFPFVRKEREKENNRSGNAQVEWTLRGTKLQIVCPTTQDPFQAGTIFGFADERLDDADSADNKLGACRYGCLVTNDPKILAWYKTDGGKASAATELARYFGIAKEFANGKLEDREYRFKFDGQKSGRLGNIETVPWKGRLRIRETAGWVAASYIEQREEDANGPAEEFWRSSLLAGNPQDAVKEAIQGTSELRAKPKIVPTR